MKYVFKNIFKYKAITTSTIYIYTINIDKKYTCWSDPTINK